MGPGPGHHIQKICFLSTYSRLQTAQGESHGENSMSRQAGCFCFRASLGAAHRGPEPLRQGQLGERVCTCPGVPVGGLAGSRCGKPWPPPQPTRHGSQGEDTAPGPDGPHRSVSDPFLTCASPAATIRQQLEDTEAAGIFQKRPVLEDEVEVSKQRRGAGRK